MVRKISGNKNGFTLIELLIVIAIIEVLAVIATSKYTQFKTRANDAHSKASLQDIYLTCKLYWHDTISDNDCTLTTNTTYGFTASPSVTATASGDLSDFSSTTSHSQSSTTCTIKAQGAIS